MNSGAGPLVMFQVPSPLANATGMDPHPGVCRTKAIAVASRPLVTAQIASASGGVGEETSAMNASFDQMVMFQVPSPLANATGMDPHPGVCRTKAMSVSPLPLKSPAITRTPGVLEHESPPMNSGAGPLVMFQVPSPLANATGMDPHPGVCRTKAIELAWRTFVTGRPGKGSSELTVSPCSAAVRSA